MKIVVADGIVAKNPDNDVNTSQDHINDGNLSTRFISFTTALPVALMYWAQDYSSKQKQRKDRVLLEIDVRSRFLVWEVVVRDMLPSHTAAQGRATVDREVIIEPASHSLSQACIRASFDCHRCYDENEIFRTLVDGTPPKASYDKFASKYLDMRDGLLNEYRVQ